MVFLYFLKRIVIFLHHLNLLSLEENVLSITDKIAIIFQEDSPPSGSKRLHQNMSQQKFRPSSPKEITSE